MPFAIDRLVFAAALFTGSAICYSDLPKPEPGEIVGVWDELWMGREKKLGWLGKPLGTGERLAERQNNLLAGVDVLGLLRGDGISFVRAGDEIKISATNPQSTNLQFSLTVPANGANLVLVLRARADQMLNAPPESARVIRFDQSHAWVKADAFTYRHYLAGVSTAQALIGFDVEGADLIFLSNIAAYAFPDAWYREFEHGLVLANPSLHPFTFDLQALLPNGIWRRLNGSSQQDPTANNGEHVGFPVQLSARDALFLVRVE